MDFYTARWLDLVGGLPEDQLSLGQFDRLFEDLEAFLRRVGAPVPDDFVERAAAVPGVHVGTRGPYAAYDHQVAAPFAQPAEETDRIAHVVEEAEAQHDVERRVICEVRLEDVRLAERIPVGVDPCGLEDQLSLLDVHLPRVEADHVGAAGLNRTQAPEPGVASEVQHAPPRQRAAAQLDEGVEEVPAPLFMAVDQPFVVNRRSDAAEIDGVVPARELCDALLEFLP